MTPTQRANEIERWFLQHGVPDLIESDNDASITTLLSAWAPSNWLRGMAAVRPAAIDGPELLPSVSGPAIPVLTFGQGAVADAHPVAP